MTDAKSDLVYRLVRTLYEGSKERGFKNVGIALCNMDSYGVRVGPHPGFSDDERVLLLEFDEPSVKQTYPILFLPEDERPARQLAHALLAWADWIEETEKQDEASEAKP